MTLTKWMVLAGFSILVGPVASAAPGQTSPTACSATAANDATISGTAAVAGADIFSGELLRTSGDGSLIIACGTVRFALASGSSMRVFQTAAETSVELENGIVSYSTGGHSENLTLYSLDVKIVPDTQQPTVGQVDVSSHCELSVQSTKGTVAVTSEKETKIVQESKAYDVTPKLGVDYSDDWRPVPADYPEFPHDAKYHDSHHHVACAAAAPENASVRAPLDPEVFRAITVAGALGGTGIAIWKIESESPYKPH
jgi:hypothetical protein